MSENEPPKRRALGRGIEALLPRPKSEIASQAFNPKADEGAASGSPVELSLASIDRNPFQTRSNFDELLLLELAESIKTSGVVQPILVRRTAQDRYQLIAGERRWLASQKAGRETIPALIRQVSDQQALEITIVENLQRADLNSLEQARAFERLSREFRMTQEQIAVRTGKDRASVGNFMRLLRLPVAVQEMISSGLLSFGHAKVLLTLERPEDIIVAAKRIQALSMSVRQTEVMIQDMLQPDAAKRKARLKEPLDPNVREARDELQRALGLKVIIEDRQGKGRVIIEYSHLEDFDSLMDAIVRD